MRFIEVRSNDFEDGGMMSDANAARGENLSPQLSWDRIDGVGSWVIIADDPDAPNGTFVHWVLFDLPSDKTSLPSGVSGTGNKLTAGTEGKNSKGTIGYTGPNPPSGTHRYFFKVYGLDSALDLNEGATKEQVLAEMDKYNKIAEGQIMGRYNAEGGEAAKSTTTH